MNSMHSLNKVLELDVYGTEMDIDLTKDSVLVLYHDMKLEDGTNMSGKIRDKIWSDIKEARYKWPKFNKVNIIRASDFFDQRNNLKQFTYVFDTRIQTGDDNNRLISFSNKLLDLIKKYNLEGNCFIESYHIQFLKLLEAKNATLKLFIHASSYKDALAASTVVNLYGITMDKTLITKEEISDAHRHNLRVSLFNLDTENKNLQAIDLNPDYMQSDKCDYLLNALN